VTVAPVVTVTEVPNEPAWLAPAWTAARRSWGWMTMPLADWPAIAATSVARENRETMPSVLLHQPGRALGSA